jgi:hypothetical protein
MHQAITILQGLDPPGYPAIDGVNPLETILGKFGDPPCEELDIGVAESSLTGFQESRGSAAMFSKG